MAGESLLQAPDSKPPGSGAKLVMHTMPVEQTMCAGALFQHEQNSTFPCQSPF